MITKLVIRHFKGIEEKTYEFGKFDLLVGRNNSGKSTILQALSIWSYSIELLKNKPQKTGNKAIQEILSNFSPLPVPEFKLLWYNLRERRAKSENTSKGTTPIPIEIIVTWTKNGISYSFSISIKYQSAQAIFIGPSNGWKEFHEVKDFFPKILYVPPFSMIEPHEQRKDIPVIRSAIGKFQPGSVLRNVLLLIYNENANTNKNSIKPEDQKRWSRFAEFFKSNFSVSLEFPIYDKERDEYIICKYNNEHWKPTGNQKLPKIKMHLSKNEKVSLDIISAGTGFHQTLILFSFLEYYKPDIVLFDEPDAHLHTDLQKVVLDKLKKHSNESSLQCIVATHSPDFINNVHEDEILFLKQDKSPIRQVIKGSILSALSLTNNQDLVWCMSYPNILFVEGDSDKIILNTVLDKKNLTEFRKIILFDTMNGGDKDTMKRLSDEKTDTLNTLLPEDKKLKRLTVMDRDEPNSYQAQPENPVHFTWRWRSIDNFFLYSPIWKRTIKQISIDNALSESIILEGEKVIDDFFKSERFELQEGESFATIDSSLFQDAYGKRILFKGDGSFESLFDRLVKVHPEFKCTRERLVNAFQPEELPAEFERFAKKVEVVFGGKE